MTFAHKEMIEIRSEFKPPIWRTIGYLILFDAACLLLSQNFSPGYIVILLLVNAIYLTGSILTKDVVAINVGSGIINVTRANRLGIFSVEAFMMADISFSLREERISMRGGRHQVFRILDKNKKCLVKLVSDWDGWSEQLILELDNELRKMSVANQ